MRRELTCIVAAASAAAMLSTSAFALEPTQDIMSYAAQMEAEYGLPSGLLLSVAEVESDFDPYCRTGKCHGLMQIHSAYANEYARQAGMDSYDLFNPQDSLRIAASMLSVYLEKYEGDLHYALMCYNLGEYGAKTKRAGGADTTSYSRKVVSKIEGWASKVVQEPENDYIEPENDHVGELVAILHGIMQRFVEVLFK